jgi:NAD(P)-dependent dehydrogenase (short-subunit alcohol dehydrogenase family)
MAQAEVGATGARYLDLDGKHAVVTGGAEGIGAAIVAELLAQGMTVAVADVKTPPPAERVLFRETDLAEPGEIEKFAQAVRNELGTVHVLVNNAAIDHRFALERTTLADWDRMNAVNLRAPFWLTRELLPALREAGGASIVNIGSIQFDWAQERLAIYAATKGGLVGMTRSLARELGPDGIRVNCVQPGWIMTERQLNQYVDEEARSLILDRQSVKHLPKPEEVAHVVAFLASGVSGILSGQRILADGGWMFS